ALRADTEVVVAPALVHRLVAHQEADLPADQLGQLLAALGVGQALVHAHEGLHAVDVRPDVVQHVGAARAGLGQELDQVLLAAPTRLAGVGPVAAGLDQGGDAHRRDGTLVRLEPARHRRVDRHAPLERGAAPGAVLVLAAHQEIHAAADRGV